GKILVTIHDRYVASVKLALLSRQHSGITDLLSIQVFHVFLQCSCKELLHFHQVTRLPQFFRKGRAWLRNANRSSPTVYDGFPFLFDPPRALFFAGGASRRLSGTCQRPQYLKCAFARRSF